MNILITGVPAVGKTIIAKKFAEFGFTVFSDKDFLTESNSTDVDVSGQKLKDVDLTKFSKQVNTKLGKMKIVDSVVFEGILFPYCLKELKIKFDYILILSLNETELLKRYKLRKYHDLKIYDNLFVQENDILYNTIMTDIKKRTNRKDIMKQNPQIIKVELLGNLKKDFEKIVDKINFVCHFK